jgi:hypothetical protein
MPDDPRLGQFRERFAGLLGTIEVRPDEGPEDVAGFADATRVVGSESFLDRLENDPSNRLDRSAYVRARLLDAFVGDWDRHPDQWRWAGFAEGDSIRWEPIPRDRDWALARLEGLLVWVAGFAFPNYVGFDDDYPSAFRLTWTARVLDRRLLSGVPAATWDTVAADIVRRIDDVTIEEAVRRLPREYHERIGEDLSDALRERRDDLPRLAHEMYLLFAGWVDVHATDADEIATVERLDGRRVRVEIARREGDTAAAPPHFARTFVSTETHEIRIDMRGGDDRVVVRGANGGITVRVIGGGSDDTMIDETGGADVRFYDDRGDNVFITAAGTHVDESEYDEPDTGDDTAAAPPRDWGSYWLPVPHLSYEPDIGTYIGMGANRYGYGFRYSPWKTRLTFSAGFGTGADWFRGHIDYDFPLHGSVRARLAVRYTGADRYNFYGFGNETDSDSATSFYHADRRDLLLTAVATVRPTPRSELSAGPAFKLSTPFREAGTLLDTLDPYGAGRFEEMGVQAGFVRDSRNHRTAATAGTLLRLDGRFFPAWLDVVEPFGMLRGETAVYLAPDTAGSITLALRAGGEKIWGDSPYHDATYLGGSNTIRGYANRRFAGDASAFGNAELRVPLAGFFLTLPVHFGVFGVADAGRVFVAGESSSKWHTAAGGGLWFAALHPANVMTIALVRGEEQTGLYVKAGFQF